MNLFKRRSKYSDTTIRHKGGTMEVNKWVISKFVIDKLVPIVSVHPFPLDELMFLTSSVCWIKPDYVFEWGTHVGKSARIFYEVKKTFNSKNNRKISYHTTSEETF